MQRMPLQSVLMLSQMILAGPMRSSAGTKPQNLLSRLLSRLSPTVWVHETATVAPTAFLGAPCIIGPGTEVRHCAFIRVPFSVSFKFNLH